MCPASRPISPAAARSVLREPHILGMQGSLLHEPGDWAVPDSQFNPAHSATPSPSHELATGGPATGWPHGSLKPTPLVTGPDKRCLPVSTQMGGRAASGCVPSYRGRAGVPHLGAEPLVSCRETTWWGSTAACCAPRSSVPRAASSTTSSRPTRRWAGPGNRADRGGIQGPRRDPGPVVTCGGIGSGTGGRWRSGSIEGSGYFS